MTKTYKRKPWTKEEEQLLIDLAGVYDAAIIGKKLKRTKYSVWGKLRYMGIYVANVKRDRGVPPVDFAKNMGMNKNNVWNWIHRWQLPIVKYPGYMKLDKKYIKSMLVDDTKIEEWLMNGYVYSDQINPIDPYYKKIVENVRRKMDFEYISSQDIIATCNITPKILQYWRHLRNFPRPALQIPTKIILYSRPSVVEWANNNPHYITKLQAANLRTAGIGKNMEER